MSETGTITPSISERLSILSAREMFVLAAGRRDEIEASGGGFRNRIFITDGREEWV